MFRVALRSQVEARANYDADVADYYANGDGRAPEWVTEHDADGYPRNVNIGGLGYRYPRCPHGMSLWTDYDNICGGCEDSRTAIQDAQAIARNQFATFSRRWAWAETLPSDLPSEIRTDILGWVLNTD